MHTAQRKHTSLVKTKEKSKPQKKIAKKIVSLGLLHQILGQRTTRSLLDVDTEIFWKDIDIRVYNDPFCTACQISTINKILDQRHL